MKTHRFNVQVVRRRTINPLCQCPLGAGFCSRHQVNKGARQVELCKGIADSPSCGKTYWLAWERDAHQRGILDNPILDNPQGFDCHGPRSPLQSGSRPAASQDGPGNELHKILLEYGYDIQPGCACRGTMLRMNLWGSAGTRLNRETVIDTMYQEFRKRHPIASKLIPGGLTRAVAAAWVDEAIRRWDEKQTRQTPTESKPRLSLPSDIPVVASVAPRAASLHKRTFASVRAAGFSRVFASCEPGVDVSHVDANITLHPDKRGQWRNFLEVLKIGIATGDGYFITVEDDIEMCKGTAEFLSNTGWPAPDCGCLALYSSLFALQHYPSGRRSRLSEKHAKWLLGACALMFRRDAAIALLDWGEKRGWRGDVDTTIEDPASKKSSDTYVGEVLTTLGYSIWSHNPTLVNHIGAESTLGHPSGIKSITRQPMSFPGVNADLAAIFAEELR